MNEVMNMARNMKSAEESRTGRSKLQCMIGTISSVLTGGRKVNIKSTTESEVKDVRMMAPYGIASAPYKGMQVQVIYNDGATTVVGIFDKNKPKINPGDIVIYNKSGSTISLLADGTIELDGNINANGTFKINGQTVEQIVASMAVLK